ncbi:MAG: hypothetical protein ABSC37_01690 [Xanthobacteraceae bacterium]
MYLGRCKIRSAGRTSGSIEITLPPALQTFTGLGCRVVVRDGPLPEIVLQPDFADAWSSLEALWEKLSLALGSHESIGDLAPRAFMLTMLPPRHSQRGLPLAYSDLVTLTRSGEIRTKAELEVLARVLSVLAAAVAHVLGLEQAFALGFGDAVAYVLTQVSAGFGTDFERSMAASLSRQAHFRPRLPLSPFDDEFWLECEPALRRIHEQFRSWQGKPERYEAAQQQWYRALQCESVPGCVDPRAAAYE